MSDEQSLLRARALLLAFAHLILTIDFTIVYVALPSLARELSFSQQTSQWAVHAYTLTFGGFLLLGGRASDRLDRSHVLIAALVLFAGGSALGGVATGQEAVLVSRVTQGLAAALIFPATLALINGHFDEGLPRASALALWSLAGPSGLAVGSVLGGMLVSLFGWRSVFLFNVPAAAGAAAAALLLLPRTTSGSGHGSFNIAGGALITGATTALIFALVQGPEWGWSSFSVLIAATASVILGSAFALHERRHSAPLVPVELLRAPALVKGMVLTALFMSAFMTLSYVLTTTFQDLLGYSPWATGLAFLVPCLSQAAGTQLSVPVGQRLGLRATLMLGFAIAASGTALLAASIGASGAFWTFVPGLVVSFVGQGIAFAPMWAAVTHGVPTHRHGIASAMASTTFQIGGAVGMSLLLVVSRSPLLSDHSQGLSLPTIQNGVLAASAMYVLALLVARTVELPRGLARASEGEQQ